MSARTKYFVVGGTPVKVIAGDDGVSVLAWDSTGLRHRARMLIPILTEDPSVREISQSEFESAIGRLHHASAR